MTVESVYFLELLYSIDIDKCCQFLQQRKKKKASWQTSRAWNRGGNRWEGTTRSPVTVGSGFTRAPVSGNFLSIIQKSLDLTI